MLILLQLFNLDEKRALVTPFTQGYPETLPEVVLYFKGILSQNLIILQFNERTRNNYDVIYVPFDA